MVADIRWRRAVLYCLILGLAGACAPGTRAPDEAPPEPQARSERCLRVSDIQNWRVVDNRQLVVFGRRPEDAWHVRLFASCSDIGIAETVAFRARGTNLLCGDPGDEIITRSGRCPIASLRRISPLEVTELTDRRVRKDIGKLPPREQTATPDKQPEKQ